MVAVDLIASCLDSIRQVRSLPEFPFAGSVFYVVCSLFSYRPFEKNPVLLVQNFPTVKKPNILERVVKHVAALLLTHSTCEKLDNNCSCVMIFLSSDIILLLAFTIEADLFRGLLLLCRLETRLRTR
jgi:hypothetical protein